MPFTPKSWGNFAAGGTPLSAAAMIDLETRLSNYTDSISVGVPYVDAELNGVTATPHALGQPALDQAPILQALLRAGATNGQTVVLPKGVIWVGSQILVPYGTRLVGQGKNATRIQARSDFPINTAVVRLGDYPIEPDVIFNTRIEHLAISAADLTGGTCVYTTQVQEGCGVFNCHLSGYKGYGVWAEGQNFELHELECIQSATGALAGIYCHGISGACHISRVTTGNLANSGDGILLSGCVARISDIHIEGTQYGINLDGGTGLIENIVGDPYVTNLVRFQSNATSWACVGINAAGSTNTILDDWNGLTIPSSINSGFVSFYTQYATAIGKTGMRSENTVPVVGIRSRGDIVWNNVPSELGTGGSKYVLIGWICTVAGTPGTWMQMRTLTGN